MKQLNCLTRPEVLELFTGKDAEIGRDFISEPVIKTLAKNIEQESSDQGLEEKDLILLLAQTSLLALVLLEMLKAKTKWPKDITA